MQVTDILLHQKSKILEVTFDDNKVCKLSYVYLRKNSPSAETKVKKFSGTDVMIEAIEPVGNYAIKIHFSDGHNSGLYTWELLYKLGENIMKPKAS
ncbi:MAG: 1-(5-phosphoribosyl)-5-((5-phosphoribosylamino)methylideneamino)imidazole-4-carboxamide isomerase [Thiotrichales bacterium]|nr:MAG: 1-(5-phosphoribosyl)-5-((5-phosphoribosylamino)methylideneamino)imidazole-4-carboxamide isomerase [Thiotrichales bacterium]